MKKLFCLSLCLMALSLWAGNSIFSYYGYPVQFYGRDVYSMGMGDTGASDIFRYNTGYANPAQSNLSNKTMFGTGIVLGYTQYESEYDQVKRTFTDDALDFPYFSISIPYHKHRFAFQFNSFASGLVKNEHTLADSSVERQEADKYIYRADLIYSHRIKNLSLGISGNYYFGHDKRTFEQNSSSNTVQPVESTIKNFKNPTLTLGAIQSLGRNSIGFHTTLPVTLKGESTRSSSHTTEDPIDYEYKLPAQYTLSLTTKPMEELKVASDFSFEAYSAVDDNMQDSWKLGMGIAYEPLSGNKKHWWKSFPARIGASYRTLPFVDSENEYVNETGFSAGFSIPLKREENRLDLALQYLKRGALDTNKLTESSYMLMIGLSGFDIISRAPDRTAPREIPVAEDFD